MRLKTALLSGVLPLAIAAYSHAEILPASQTSNSWFSDGKALTENKAGNTANNSSAKNVILFVGDGMGTSTLTAARILQGQQNGQTGEENFLSFESFPYSALVKTYNVDAQTPDSAGTMTAMISGVKTDAGVIGVSEAVERGDCESAQQNPLITAIELAELKGLATGIISTARITHATPAAAYAKSADRNWEDISDMPAAAIDAGCEDIASQLINFESNLEARIDGADVDGIDVVMGGGRRHFLPKDASANSPDALSSVEGDRTDSRNLVTEWQSQYSDGVYVYDEDGFNAVDAASTNRLFGLFNESHMQYEADRANDVAGEPSLSAMTGKAIDILAKNNNGYMMVVESGRIDHGHHAGSAYSALTDAIEFANAVQTAIDNTNPDETLILVTADHSHVFTIAGYPKRGNPILGKVVSVGKTTPELAADGMPYTTLGYTNGLGFRALGSETDGDASYSAGPDTGRKDLSSVDTTSTGYHQEALVPLGSETHAGEDISLHAMGPGASKVQGVIEQNVVFHVINQALGLIDAE
ncbi:alkaline phosphatase [Spongiibacter tropicus]|uniref:alkaline phosphatase n=1 Tax=Spongiibacter tropicus TaxID=454602 RepID=UPI003A99C388